MDVENNASHKLSVVLKAVIELMGQRDSCKRGTFDDPFIYSKAFEIIGQLSKIVLKQR